MTRLLCLYCGRPLDPHATFTCRRCTGSVRSAEARIVERLVDAGDDLHAAMAAGQIEDPDALDEAIDLLEAP